MDVGLRNDGIASGNLIRIVAKYALLVMISLLSSLIACGYWVVFTSEPTDPDDMQVFLRFKIGEYLIALDCLINALCLILQFRFNSKWYYCFCGFCDRVCFGWFHNDRVVTLSTLTLSRTDSTAI